MDTHPPVPAELPSLLPVSVSKRSRKTPFVVLLFALVQALSMNWFLTASSFTNAEVKMSQAGEYCKSKMAEECETKRCSPMLVVVPAVLSMGRGFGDAEIQSVIVANIHIKSM